MASVDSDESQDSIGYNRIYFNINGDYHILSGLTDHRYEELANHDEYALEYCRKKYASKDGLSELARSMDGIDYTQIFKLNVVQEDVLESENDDLDENHGSHNANDAATNSGKVSKFIPRQRKNKVSDIWDHVQKVDPGRKLQCNYCKKRLKNCNNTTNMRKHLEALHPGFFVVKKKLWNSPTSQQSSGATKRKRQSKSSNASPEINKHKGLRTSFPQDTEGILQAFHRISSVKGGSRRDFITNSIIFMIASDLQPISIVENKGFKFLLKVLAPLYEVPSRRTMTRHIESRYNVMKLTFIEKIKKAQAYSITCDNWTDCGNQSYMGITIHYLDNFQLESPSLGCIPLYERHNAEYLAEVLRDTLNEFSIDFEKVEVIVSDGDGAISNACTSLVGADRHLVCYAHTLAHILPEAVAGIELLNTTIEKVMSIVKLIKRSIPASDSLRKQQEKRILEEEEEVKEKEAQKQKEKEEDLNLDKQTQKDSGGEKEKEKQPRRQQLKLIMDVATSRTTKVEMIERYLELDDYVYIAMKCCRNPIDVLTTQETELLTDVLPLMRIVTNAITELSSSTYATASMVIPVVNCIIQDFQNTIVKTQTAQLLKCKLEEVLNRRTKQIENISVLRVATLLDPRFKKIHFRDRTKAMSGLRRIDSELKKTKTKSDSVQDNQNVNSAKNPIWNYHLALTQTPAVQSTLSRYEFHSTDPFHPELQQYLNMDLIHVEENVIAYWKSVPIALPNLSAIAMK